MVNRNVKIKEKKQGLKYSESEKYDHPLKCLTNAPVERNQSKWM